MGKIKVDQIEVESASSVQINNPLKVDNISEKTSGSGVVISKPKSTIQTLTSSSNTLTINVENGTVGAVTLNENITDIDFTNVPSTGEFVFTLKVTQASSSSYTLTNRKITVNGGSEAVGYFKTSSVFTSTSTNSRTDILKYIFYNAGTPFIDYENNYSQEPELAQSSNLLFNINLNNGSYSGSGSTVTDLSSNGFNFNKVGTPTYSADSDGDYRFTGFSTSNHLQSAANTGISTNTEPLTITALVSESTTNSYAGVVGQGYDTNQTHFAAISYSGKFGTDHWEPGGWYAAAHTLNQKYLVTWVFPTMEARSTAAGKIYFSGTEQSKTLYGTASNNAPANTTMQIGIWKPSRTDMVFNGSIYAVAIWNHALNATEIASNHNDYYSYWFTY